MNIDLATGSGDLTRTSLFVVGAFSDGSLTPSARFLPAETQARLAALVIAGELKREIGSQLQLFGLSAELSRKILLVALGSGERLSETAYRTALAATAQTLRDSLSTEAVVTLTEVEVAGRPVEWRIEQAAWLLADGAYRFTLPTVERGPDPPRAGVEFITLVVPGAVAPAQETAARRGLVIAEGMGLAKDLVNLPGNVCTPGYMSKLACSIAAKFALHVEVFEEPDLIKLGMGALLAVGRSERSTSKLVVMGYRGGPPSARPIVLVGQGLTGGGSARHGASAAGPKLGMSGAAAVLGTLWTVARSGLPINVFGLMPMAEIVPGANPHRPGDIIRSMSGQMIEITSHTACGNLILCDALSYAEHFDPGCVIDVAAQGGAAVVALGSHTNSVFTNDAELGQALVASSLESGDRAWQLPLWDDCRTQPRGSMADTSSLGGPQAEEETAACFLMRFADKFRWAHIDIAGTAMFDGPAKGATGRPVPLLTNFLIKRAGRSRPSEPRRETSEADARSGSALPQLPPFS